MRINKRLLAITDYVDDNSNIIDVGCDHALLDIYLVQNKKNVFCIASDINEGPLEQARKNIEKYNLEDKIKTKLGNGIEPIEQNIDTIIISGMGGSTITEILKNKDKLINVKKIILSPNNDFYKVRKTMNKMRYKIICEKMILDRGKFYPIIVLEKGIERLNRRKLLYGSCVKNNDDYKKYIFYLKDNLEFKLNSIPKKYIIKRFLIKKQISFLCKND